MGDVLIVLTNAIEGGDEEFNRWYDGRHLDDVLALGPFTAAQRFRLADADLGDGPAPYRYLAIYEVADGRLEEARDALLAARAEREGALAAGREPLMPMTPAMADERVSWFFSPLGERREARADGA